VEIVAAFPVDRQALVTRRGSGRASDANSQVLRVAFLLLSALSGAKVPLRYRATASRQVPRTDETSLSLLADHILLTTATTCDVAISSP
jgi:hypothetical protein